MQGSQDLLISVTKMSAKAFHSAIDYFAERSSAANEKFKAYYIIFLANLALKINLKVPDYGYGYVSLKPHIAQIFVVVNIFFCLQSYITIFYALSTVSICTICV